MYSLPNATKNERFGQLCRSFRKQKTRCRIYSVDPSLTIDYSSEAQVIYYGTLLVYRGGDTDSNGRIASSGLKFTEYYNKDQDRKIGLSATTQIEVSFINDDGAMASFDWGYDAVVYLDIYDSDNAEWLTCPLGVFEWETPDSISKEIVSATAYNFMNRLGNTESLISNEDYSESPTLYDITYRYYGGDGGYMGMKFGIPNDGSTFPYKSKTYSSLPYDDSGMSARDSLEKIAEINWKNAYVDRTATIRFRSWAYLPNYPSRPEAHVVWTISADTVPSHIKKLKIAEYNVPKITAVSAEIGQIGASAKSGSGDEVYRIYDNGFFRPKNDLESICEHIRSGLTSLFNTTYRPITVELLEGDPRIEGGDLVSITKGGTNYLLPVFQQTIEWRGGTFKQTLMSFGRRSIQDNGYASNKEHNISSRIYNASSQVGIESMRSVASGSTDTIDVSFGVPFNFVPKVVACLFSSQTVGMGQCSASVYNITTTGFSLRLTNNYSVSRDIGATWIATT